MDTYFYAKRSEAALELNQDPKALSLLYAIARRARRTPGVVWINNCSFYLEIGEALIGDIKNIGLTEKEYREAKKRLERRGFAAFRRANKGTIARLINQDVFDINPEEGANKTADSTATKGRGEGGQGAINNNVKKFKNDNNKQQNKVFFKINGKEVPEHLWKFVSEKCGGNDYDAALIFFRAQYAKNLPAYIFAGFSKGYINKPCKEELSNSPKVKRWIEILLDKIYQNCNSSLEIPTVNIKGM